MHDSRPLYLSFIQIRNTTNLGGTRWHLIKKKYAPKFELKRTQIWLGVCTHNCHQLS
uniref:Uncharacterized protein n=1 Tax=Arundo donax TaxID=35708 RepID=A0A0A9BE67_ARUDO